MDSCTSQLLGLWPHDHPSAWPSIRTCGLMQHSSSPTCKHKGPLPPVPIPAPLPPHTHSPPPNTLTCRLSSMPVLAPPPPHHPLTHRLSSMPAPLPPPSPAGCPPGWRGDPPPPSPAGCPPGRRGDTPPPHLQAVLQVGEGTPPHTHTPLTCRLSSRSERGPRPTRSHLLMTITSAHCTCRWARGRRGGRGHTLNH